jgi:ADP-ribose pyrophosphatase YjhB (NUDIX family)
MPAPVSKRQLRYMHAIMSGKEGTSSRGDRVPKSVAEKYTGHGKSGDLPEDKGKSYSGGKWTDKHHAKAKEKSKGKSKLKKAFQDFYKGRGAGAIVIDKQGRILLGKRDDDKLWATPGGHVEPDETFEEGALRELQEESGIIGYLPEEVWADTARGNESKAFLIHRYEGKIKGNGELTDLKFMDLADIPWDRLRTETAEGIKAVLQSRVKKSLKDMVAIETLEKNIIRGNGRGAAVYEMTHGDALKLVGNGTFRFLRRVVADMGDEDFKDVKIDTYTLSIRKHINDVYSGRISDGHKIVHQFTNRSLPGLAAELMSVFEWYLPEDEPELEAIIDQDIPDDAIFGGMNELIDNYKKNNIANIYHEMENIREEIRNGAAVDLQQVESRIMTLFDKLEDFVQELASKHNRLASDASKEIDDLENKLIQLQTKIDELSSKPTTVEAYASKPVRPSALMEEDYCYLSRPCIEISPNGKIKIKFGPDWNYMDQENFVKDMRAKVVKKSRG